MRKWIWTAKQDRYLEFGFLLFLFLFYLAWCLAQPFNRVPDELMRYQIPQYIFEHGALPHGGDPALRNPNWGISYAFTPILSYMFSAVFMWITSLFSSAPAALLIAARLVSVVCSVGTGAVCIAISKQVFRARRFRWMFVVLVTMLPQFAFISSYVNVDALAMLSTALLVHAWILGLKSGWSVKSVVYLGIGLSVCALSYYNAYGFLLCSALLFALSFFLLPNQRGLAYRPMLTKGLLVVGIVLLLAGWWFVRNAILYDGDFLGFATSNQYAEQYAVDGLKPSQIKNPANMGTTFWGMLTVQKWLLFTSVSFFGTFGYMNLPIPTWLFTLFVAAAAVGVLCCLLSVKQFFPRKQGKDGKRTTLFHVLLLLALFLPILISFIYSYYNDFQPQGRYILPLLLPLAYFLTQGVHLVLDRFVNNRILAYLIPAGFICLWGGGSVYSLLFIILPAYQGQPFIG